MDEPTVFTFTDMDDLQERTDTQCELVNGEVIPLMKPVSYSSKMKARHIATAGQKYKSINDLAKYLDKGMKITCIRGISCPQSIEEQLLSLTHRVVVVAREVGPDYNCLVPVDETGLFIRYTQKNKRASSNMFYRSVADNNGFVLLSFKMEMRATETQVNFDVTYIDSYSLDVTKHTESITIPKVSKFKFNILINCRLFCILWPFHKCFSVLDFSSSDTMKFIQYTMDEELDGFYVAELNGEYLSITTNNLSFNDDVFFDSDGSKRDTVYYSLRTGARHSSKTALQKIAKIMSIENPVDVVFISMPNRPMWMVTECLSGEMTENLLSSITFFCDVAKEDSAIRCVQKRIDLNDLFSKHRDLFETRNEHQINFEICRIQWRLYLWISRRHILAVDLHTFQVLTVLEMASNEFNDYRNELNDFTIKIAMNRKDINIFVKDQKSIKHFETFQLPYPQTLKHIATYAVVKCYSKAYVEKSSLNYDIKNELLVSY